MCVVVRLLGWVINVYVKPEDCLPSWVPRWGVWGIEGGGGCVKGWGEGKERDRKMGEGGERVVWEVSDFPWRMAFSCGGLKGH